MPGPALPRSAHGDLSGLSTILRLPMVNANRHMMGYDQDAGLSCIARICMDGAS